MINNKKILWIEVGGHDVHDKFASVVADKKIKITDKIPKDYDVYIVEGSYMKAALLKRKLKNKKIVTLFPDPRLYQLTQKITTSPKSGIPKKSPKIRTIIQKHLIKKIDGAICLCKFNADLFRQFNNSAPMVTAYGFIENARFDALKKVNPNLNNQNLLFIGDGPDPHVKGLDLLIEVFKELKISFPELKLNILGRRWNTEEFQGEDIKFHGRVDIVPFLKDSTLLIHLGRGEAFGLNIVESMLAGVPVLTSDATGAKEVVEEWDSSFVQPLNKTQIKKKIQEYLLLSTRNKEATTKGIRTPTLKFKEDDVIKLFKKKTEELIKKMFTS